MRTIIILTFLVISSLSSAQNQGGHYFHVDSNARQYPIEDHIFLHTNDSFTAACLCWSGGSFSGIWSLKADSIKLIFDYTYNNPKAEFEILNYIQEENISEDSMVLRIFDSTGLPLVAVYLNNPNLSSDIHGYLKIPRTAGWIFLRYQQDIDFWSLIDLPENVISMTFKLKSTAKVEHFEYIIMPTNSAEYYTLRNSYNNDWIANLKKTDFWTQIGMPQK